ncbi:MAG: 30S ribosomal protein S9 [Patescibacteria group bacterium]|nr:30S ribosomal protein S9 [Patescibacteria group bacterium]MDE2589104.1 30S ribosomal protein S9 [Patescibacteria group bacterium]
MVKTTKRDYTYAVGRQREAIARVRIYAHVKDGLMWDNIPVQKAQILVNGEPIEKYFPGPVYKATYMKPFTVTNTADKYAVTVKVAGGGRSGQLDAMVQGVARALSSLDGTKFRPVLKKAGLLTRDARVRERRKVGTGGKARRKKQSPKR